MIPHGPLIVWLPPSSGVGVVVMVPVPVPVAPTVVVSPAVVVVVVLVWPTTPLPHPARRREASRAREAELAARLRTSSRPDPHTDAVPRRDSFALLTNQRLSIVRVNGARAAGWGLAGQLRSSSWAATIRTPPGALRAWHIRGAHPGEGCPRD